MASDPYARQRLISQVTRMVIYVFYHAHATINTSLQVLSFKEYMKSKTNFKQSAFTIVELLVVIVVIGILAAITIVSYTGISKKATASSLQSDLKGIKNQLELYKVDNSTYPTALDVNKCPSFPNVGTNYCLKSSGGNNISFYVGSSSLFYIMTKNGTTCYDISNNSSPTLNSSCVPTGWIAGITATALAGKYVRSTDLGSNMQYKTTDTSVISPHGVIGLDPSYLSNMSLINPQVNISIDFSAYPAQNACMVVGGRLPNMQELNAIYEGRSSYGNNFQSGWYWSSTEYNSITAQEVWFLNGEWGIDSKTFFGPVRCVLG